MDISYDGVSVSKSCGRSFEILSGKFLPCRQVYPLAVGMAEKGFSDTMKAEEVSKRTLINLRKEGVHVRHMISDAPKRAGGINWLTLIHFRLNEIEFHFAPVLQSAGTKKAIIATTPVISAYGGPHTMNPEQTLGIEGKKQKEQQ